MNNQYPDLSQKKEQNFPVNADFEQVNYRRSAEASGNFPNYPDNPADENYEIYHEGYSTRQRCIIGLAILFFILVIAGFILFVSKKIGGNRYPYYWLLIHSHFAFSHQPT